MAKCEKCEGLGFVRDPAADDGWARDGDGNGIVCPPRDQGGCDGKGTVTEQRELARG